MLTDQNKQAVTDALNALKSSMPNYRPRQAQLEMIGMVSNTIAEGDNGDSPVLVAEAPCGTGKTIGYGLPAIALAKDLGLKVIISTGTIALQEQLVRKDLPELSQSAGLDFRYKLLKGRNRYACTSRLAEESGYVGQAGLFDGDAPDSRGSNEEAGKYLEAYLNKEWDGDFDTFSETIDKSAREKFGSTSAQCTSSNCRFHSQCPFFDARKKELVDVFVVNHDLLLSASLAESDVLPDLDDCILIIDEAHTISGKALNHFASSSHVSSEVKWANEYAIDFVNAAPVAGLSSDVVGEFKDAIDILKNMVVELYEFAKNHPDIASGLAKNKRFKKDDWVYLRFPKGELPEYVEQLVNTAKDASNQAELLVGKLLRRIDKRMSELTIGQAEGERLTAKFGQVQHYLHSLNELCYGMLQEAEGNKPWAKWFQARNTKSEGVEIIMSASPISNGAMLKSLLWDKAHATILTSATITTVGTFDTFVSDSGLYGMENVRTTQVASPFNFREKGLLEVPMMNSEPSQFEEFSLEAASYLNIELKKTLGSLVLFCSYRQMNRVYEELDADVAAVVKVQGESSREAMLAAHADDIRNGKPSVLFGVSSLAEGLDLRRELCTQVIVVKMPFMPPDSPVEETKSEWIEGRGGNSFMELAVPNASLKLNQAVGRLLRTEDDFGRVVLLDRRLLTKRYGNLLISSLPDFTRNIGCRMPSAEAALRRA